MPIAAQQQNISNDRLLGLLSVSIQSIDYRLSTEVDVVHHKSDNSQEKSQMAQPTRPAARPAAKPAARPAKAAPVDDFEFGDEFDATEDEAPAEDVDGDGFDDFEEPAPAPTRKGARAAAAPVDDDFDGLDGIEGEASDDPDADDFAEGDAEGEGDFDADAEELEPVEEEPVVELSPKLKNAVYILPKGAKAWYVVGDEDGSWKRDKTPVDTTRAVKLTYSKKDHNYAVSGVEDKSGKTWVVLGLGKDYLVVTSGEQLLDEAKKPAKILQPKVAEPVAKAAPAKASAKAAAPVASGLTRDQKIAVKNFDNAVADLKAAFGI
jgi:hypothetical protein